MSVSAPAELVERIWAHDATLWTGGDEAQWLGWLDEPLRMRERMHDLLEFAASVDVDDVVLLGMGGSSLAPLVLARSFAAERFHVLDTTHPAAIRRLEESLDPGRTLFVVSSKSGTTIETRCHFDYFRARSGTFVAVTDPGSALAGAEGLERVFEGEPTIGGRYSALSAFGLVPAVLMGIDLARLLDRADEMREACRLAEGNPGLELGLELAETPVVRVEGDFGLWVEQLLAESTGKEGKGIVPVAEGGEPVEVRLPDPYELGQEFFRWEFGTAVAGAQLGINPFDQPNVQAAKDRTQAVLSAGDEPALEPDGDLDALLDEAEEGDWVAIQAFIDPAREDELDRLRARVRERGLPLAVGLGPRYLHSTGQLHKGGPNTIVAVQVVDDPGEELPIPGRDFGFRRLIRAQAAGDYDALRERGRRACRVTL
jgi:transaldolase / glucose-6-phosphate isomerase